MGFALSDIQLTSTAFSDGDAIPRRHTGEDADVSPPLAWQGAPAGTRAYALVCHDPDAPLISPDGSYGYVHWVIYNIPGDEAGLSEDCSDWTSGRNDFGRGGYGGPMPPPGHGLHRYYFWLLALDDDRKLDPGLSLTELLARIEPHVIGMNRLVGTYQRG